MKKAIQFLDPYEQIHKMQGQINEAQLVSNPVLRQMNEPLVKELKGDC